MRHHHRGHSAGARLEVGSPAVRRHPDQAPHGPGLARHKSAKTRCGGFPRILGGSSGAAPVMIAVRKGASMFARTSTWSGSPEELQKWADHAARTVKGFVEGLPGNAGVVFLVDRDSGTALTLTMWDSQDRKSVV